MILRSRRRIKGMSEKVLFEFRAEETEEGYNYEFRRDREALEEWMPSFMKSFLAYSNKRYRKRMQKYHNVARRRMRRRLNFYEKMYDELYAEDDKET
jgi:hypothetical protein